MRKVLGIDNAYQYLLTLKYEDRKLRLVKLQELNDWLTHLQRRPGLVNSSQGRIPQSNTQPGQQQEISPNQTLLFQFTVGHDDPFPGSTKEGNNGQQRLVPPGERTQSGSQNLGNNIHRAQTEPRTVSSKTK